MTTAQTVPFASYPIDRVLITRVRRVCLFGYFPAIRLVGRKKKKKWNKKQNTSALDCQFSVFIVLMNGYTCRRGKKIYIIKKITTRKRIKYVYKTKRAIIFPSEYIENK